MSQCYVIKQMVNAIACTIELWTHLGGLLSTLEARVAPGYRHFYVYIFYLFIYLFYFIYLFFFFGGGGRLFENFPEISHGTKEGQKLKKKFCFHYQFQSL